MKSQAQGSVESNRDAAVRALVHETDVLKRSAATFAANTQVIDSLRAPTPASLRALSGLLSTLAGIEGAPAATVCDLRGRLVAITPAQPALIGQDFSFRDWFRGVSRTGSPYVSTGYRSAATRFPLVVGVAAPVLDGSRRTGYVTVLWQLDSVRALSQGARADDGVTITVTDQAGQPLTGTLSVDDRGQPQQAPVSALTRKALAGQSVSSVSGGNILAAGPVPGVGWTVTAALPTSVGFAPERTFRDSLGATLGIALLLVLLLAVAGVRFSRRRAHELTILDDERRRLTALFEASPVGIFEGLPDGTILAVNDALAQMLGFSVSELRGMNARELTHPDSAGEVAEDMQAVRDGSLSKYAHERLYRARDGSSVPVLANAVLLPELGGEPPRMVGFIVDQREQKAAAAALQALTDALAEREAFLSTLLDTMRVSVLACDAEGVLTLINREARATHGIGEDTEPGSVFAHLAHVDGQPMDPTETPLVRALTEGDVIDAELLIETGDGRAPRRLLEHARRLIGPNGETLGALSTAHDVTAMRTAETALRDSHEQLRLLADGTPDYAIFMLDPEGRIVTWNLGAQRIKGYTEAEVIGAHVSIFYPDEQRAAGHPDHALELARTNGRYEEEGWRVRKDGSRFWADVVITGLRDEEGVLRGFSIVARDLTERQRVEAKFAGLLAAAPDAMVGVDRTGMIRFLNRQTESLFGYEHDELVGKPLETLVPESVRRVHPAHRADYIADPKTRAMGVGLELSGRRRDGTEFPVDISLSAFETADGLLVTAAVRDITERLRADQALRDSEERFRRVFDEALIGKLLASSGGSILRVNASLANLLGHETHELIGLPLTGLFDDPADQRRVQELVRAGDGQLRAEMALSDPDARSLWGLVALSWITEHDGEHVLLVQVEDITARRDAEKQLTELALHDELTGLPNRRLLMERCEHLFAVAQSGRTGSTSVAALFIDLDGFKPINDRAGHDTGDQLLVAVAHDLQSAVRPTDTVARVGGDEFIVLFEQDADLQYLRAVADRITDVIRRQVIADNTSLTLSASVGIARVDLAHEPDVGPDQLLRRADAAMYRAKERGRDRYDVFDADLQERNEARHVLAQTMRDGLRHDRISLVFQPVVDVDSGIVVGAEALMRLTNEDGQLMPTLPAVVAAETAGLAEALGDRVLQLSLDAASTWPEYMSLAVNISARELTGKDLRGRVEQALQRHDFDPTRLVLEITESSILSAGPSALADLEKLRQRGVRVAIDDFGTAYATLQNLTTLPVDALKVDVSFTAGLPSQRTHTAIVHGVASMAHELDIPCIVEGVETDVQLAALRGMSVQAQGWFWGQPQGPELVPSAGL